MIKTLNFSSNGLLGPVTTELQLIGFSRQEVFVCLYDAYLDRIQEYINGRVNDQQLAEDIAARVFVEAWEKLPAYQTGKMPILAWLYGLTHNVVTDHYQPVKAWIHEQTRPAAETGRQKSADQQQQILIQSFLTISAAGEAAPETDPRPVSDRLEEIRALRKLVTHLAVKPDEQAGIGAELNLLSFA